MTEDEARRIATSLLSERFPEFLAGKWVVTDTKKYDGAWAVFYNTRALVETGDWRHALGGNGPLVIPESGEQPWFAWSGADVADQIAQGRRCLDASPAAATD